MQRIFNITARIWIWPGDTPWHFISLDPELSRSIRENFPASSMVKVKASIKTPPAPLAARGEEEPVSGDVQWQTSLFRNKKFNNYIMPIKKDVRKRAGLQGGDVVTLEIEVV